MAQTRAYSSDALLMKRQLLNTLPPTTAVRWKADLLDSAIAACIWRQSIALRVAARLRKLSVHCSRQTPWHAAVYKPQLTTELRLHPFFCKRRAPGGDLIAMPNSHDLTCVMLACLQLLARSHRFRRSRSAVCKDT
eukprot:11630-Heterococcus_DN1.PRE.3